jgi:hypothetical protein
MLRFDRKARASGSLKGAIDATGGASVGVGAEYEW